MNPPLESLAPINIQKQNHFVIESLNHKTIRSWAIIFKRKKVVIPSSPCTNRLGVVVDKMDFCVKNKQTKCT